MQSLLRKRLNDYGFGLYGMKVCDNANSHLLLMVRKFFNTELSGGKKILHPFFRFFKFKTTVLVFSELLFLLSGYLREQILVEIPFQRLGCLDFRGITVIRLVVAISGDDVRKFVVAESLHHHD